VGFNVVNDRSGIYENGVKYLDRIIFIIYQKTPFALSLSKGAECGSTGSPRTENYQINFVQILTNDKRKI